MNDDPNHAIDPTPYDRDEVGQPTPAHDWTGKRVHPIAGPPTLAERLVAETAPLRAEIARLTAERDEARAACRDLTRAHDAHEAEVSAMTAAMRDARGKLDAVFTELTTRWREFEAVRLDAVLPPRPAQTVPPEVEQEAARLGWDPTLGSVAGWLAWRVKWLSGRVDLQDAVRDASLERDAYRAFAVRLATALASPAAEDLAAKIRLGDLDHLAEQVEERIADGRRRFAADLAEAIRRESATFTGPDDLRVRLVFAELAEQIERFGELDAAIREVRGE